MFSESTYSNPFSDYNANTMDSEQIINFWESPFGSYLLDISEDEIANEKTSIIFTGGRGTGKTMLLKHFSLMSQIVRAKKDKKLLKDYINENKYIGVYLRFDSPLLVGFDGIGGNEEEWGVIFSHFWELTVCKAFVDMLCLLKNNNVISEDESIQIVKDLNKLLGELNKNTLYDISLELGEEINYINEYKAKRVFDNIKFKPRKMYGFGALTQSVVKIIRDNVEMMNEVNFLLLLDEYENFLEFEQKIVNSTIKFSNSIAFRVGMRPMGFHTFDTVSEREFIKEHRDYRNILFENILVEKGTSGYLDFLFGIATKRLANVPFFKDNNILDLKCFLGDGENPEEEAKKIVKGHDKHITEYLKEIKKEGNIEISDKVLAQLKSPDNPLYEMQNMRMLLKPMKPDFVIKAYNDYINKIDSTEAKKYKNDYENKYKLSYVFVLRSIYKAENKQYYGFKDFAYLSSGIVGTFLELCRSAFQYAYYMDKEKLFNGAISPEIQTKAAIDVAYSEFEQIQRIAKVGNKVHRMAKNIGTLFSKYHIDKRISYPETNQFSFDYTELAECGEKKVFEAAIMWSVIQKKKGMQQASIGKDDADIYILNRIYAPVFQISVRTRGGFNVEMNKDRMIDFINNEKNAKDISIRIPREKSKQRQISMFEGEDK